MAARRKGFGGYKVSKRIILNREALTQIGLAVADGLLKVGQTIIETARPPDSPLEPYPIGQGLVLQGGVLVYVHGQKVAGWSQRGLQPKKPDKLDIPADSIMAVVGWGHPAHLIEGGTLKMPAHPFGTPAVDEVTPQIGTIMAGVVGPALAAKS